MKHLVGIGLISLLGFQAYAQEAAPAPTQKVVIRLRFDSVSNKVEVKKDAFTNPTTNAVTASTDDTTSKSGFRLTKSDMTFTNKLGDATVQMRLNPTFSAWTQETTVQGGAGLSSILDQFWIEQSLFLPELKLKAGKLDYPLYSGIERIIATSYDYYIKSYYLATYLVPDPLGFSLAYTLDKKHKFELQVDNGLPTEASLASGKAATSQSYDTNGGITVALGYFGDFDWVKPVITYANTRYAQNIYTLTDSTGNSQTDFHNDQGRTSYSVGGIFNVSGATIMAEYDGLTVKGFPYVVNGVSTTPSDVTLSTIIVDARYPVGAYTPFLKLTSDNQKNADSTKLAQTGYSIGVMYAVTPTGRINFDYDNTVKVADATTSVGKTTTTTTNYIIGTALKI